MTEAGERLIEAAKEALSIAKGEAPAARIWHNGWAYVPEPAGWQPIETAPQDGTRVLTFDPAYGIAAAAFDPYWGWIERGADYATEVWGLGEMNPTHWMPLPPSPATP